MSRYLVTGCAGFVASHLVEALLARGDSVVGVDSFTDYYARETKEANLDGFRRDPRFELVEDDLASAPLERYVDGVRGIFHLAAQAGVRGSWGDSFSVYVRDNVVATQRLFEAAAGAGVRVVFASSSSVYGNAESYPTTEAVRPRPISPYGVTKLACEHLAHAYADSLRLDFIALRYFTVYGPRQRPDMAFTRICKAILTGDRFSVYGSGEQTRDVTYVADAVTATLAVMASAPAGAVYNVGGGSETSLIDVIRTAERLAARKLEISFEETMAGDVRRTAADTTLIRQDVAWQPRTTLEEGLANQIAWAETSASTA